MSDNICPNGHVCRHGSLCTPHPYDEGAFYCDCDADFLNDQYAGLSCEHTSTTVCEYRQEVTSVKFCTNGGECHVTSDNSAAMGCDCPDDYIGDQCQFVKDTKVPDNHPLYGENFNAEFADKAQGNNNSGDGGLSAGVTAVIVLIVLGVVGGAIFVYMRKRRIDSIKRRDPTRPTEAAPEHVLEADGQVLKEAVQAGAGVNGSVMVMDMASSSNFDAPLQEPAPISMSTLESPRSEEMDQEPPMEAALETSSSQDSGYSESPSVEHEDENTLAVDNRSNRYDDEQASETTPEIV